MQNRRDIVHAGFLLAFERADFLLHFYLNLSQELSVFFIKIRVFVSYFIF